MRIVIGLLLILFSIKGIAQNGIEMVMLHKQFENNGVTVKAEKKSTIWITENKMKISSSEINEPIMIFNSEKESITLIMRDKKQYTEVSKAEFQEINRQLDESREMMEKQLAQLPESQRQMVQEKMGNMFSEAIPEIEYDMVEEGVEIGPYSTNKYDAFSNGEKIEEVFLASFDQFTVDPGYFQIYAEMIDFMKENMASMMKSFGGDSNSGSFSNTYPSLEESVPVKSISYQGKQVKSQEVLQTISEKEIPLEAFEVPAGFKKIEMMDNMKSKK